MIQWLTITAQPSPSSSTVWLFSLMEVLFSCVATLKKDLFVFIICMYTLYLYGWMSVTCMPHAWCLQRPETLTRKAILWWSEKSYFRVISFSEAAVCKPSNKGREKRHQLLWLEPGLLEAFSAGTPHSWDDLVSMPPLGDCWTVGLQECFS